MLIYTSDTTSRRSRRADFPNYPIRLSGPSSPQSCESDDDDSVPSAIASRQDPRAPLCRWHPPRKTFENALRRALGSLAVHPDRRSKQRKRPAPEPPTKMHPKPGEPQYPSFLAPIQSNVEHEGFLMLLNCLHRPGLEIP